MRVLIILFLLAQYAIGQEFVVTAYCPCKICCGKWFSKNPKTASGVSPVQGVTCAGPRSIPFGTKVHIQGVGIRTVQDRLAKRFDNRIDVFFSDHDKAKKFGKRILRVTIVAANKPK